MKKLILNTLFICVSVVTFSQASTTNGSTNLTFTRVEIDQSAFFSNQNQNFNDYQTLYINKENGEYVIMNGKSFGVPQYPENDILIFGSNKLPANYSLQIKSSSQTTNLGAGDTASISTNKTELFVSLLDENNIEISKIKIK